MFDPFFFGEEGRRRESTFSPSFVHNTVDNPYTPRSGKKFTFTPQFAGGPLGGTVNYFRPDVEFIWYIPHLKKTALGLRAEAAYIKQYGDTRPAALSTSASSWAARRRSAASTSAPSALTVNPVTGQARPWAGTSSCSSTPSTTSTSAGPCGCCSSSTPARPSSEDQNIDLKQLRTSTGVELRFIMPVLNVPFRLIYAWNPNRDAFQPKSTFKFAVGTTF